MTVRTWITLNPITQEKESLKKKYSSIKFKKPIHLIADVLTQQEKDEGNKIFKGEMAKYTQWSKNQ